jgi:hypothetical protein
MKKTIINSQFTTFTCIAASSIFTANSLKADENLFGYVYGAEVLPEGKFELYTYQTARTGKASGSYLGLDQKYELEYGLTNKLQLNFEIKTNYVDVENVPGFNDRSDFGFRGTSIGAKYNWLSPFKDPLGMSFLLEGGIVNRDATSGNRINNGYEFEAMVILQKNFFDDTLVWTTNLFVEAGSEDGDQGWGPSLFSGISYRFAENWSAGFEGHIDGDFEKIQANTIQHWDFFAGPTIHYAVKNWWATATWQTNLASYPNSGNSDLNLDDHERNEFRLKFGYNF